MVHFVSRYEIVQSESHNFTDIGENSREKPLLIYN